MRKVIWRRGDWAIEYRTGLEFCGCEHPYKYDSFIVVRRNDGEDYDVSAHWHQARFWSRNRTMVECVSLALAWVAEKELEKRRVAREMELAEEEAKALGDAAKELTDVVGLI